MSSGVSSNSNTTKSEQDIVKQLLGPGGTYVFVGSSDLINNISEPKVEAVTVHHPQQDVNLLSTSKAVDGSLPTYRVPSWPSLKKQICNITSALLSDEARTNFITALEAIEPDLIPRFETLQRGIEHASPDSNWCTARFKKFLLSLRDPIGHNSLDFLLNHVSNEQVESTTRLLCAIADLYTSKNSFDIIGSNDQGKRFETRQFAELFATVRRPADPSDELVSFGGARHVLLWRRGRVFSVQVLDKKAQPLSRSDIAAQVQQVLNEATKEIKPLSVACLSTTLNRSHWAQIYSKLSTSNTNAIHTLESAIVSVALHETVADSNEQYLKIAKEDQQDVYSDKPFGFSVFANGRIAGRVDHAAADGGVIMRVLQLLYAAIAKVPNAQVPSDGTNKAVEIHFDDLLPDQASSVPTSPVLLQKDRKSFDIPINPDVLDILRGSSLLGFTIQLALQAALFTIVGNTNLLMVEPTSVRAFKEGRCDPSYLVSAESIAVFKALSTRAPEDKLTQAFISSMLAYKRQSKEVRDGSATGPGIMILRETLSQLPESDNKSTVLKVLQLFQQPTIYFSGVPQADSVTALNANVFAPSQLALISHGKADRITFCFAGTGKFFGQLEHVHKLLATYLRVLGVIATAIAGVEQIYPGKGLPVLAEYSKGKDLITESGSVAIHAGAGEWVSNNPEEKKLVEFLLAVVTFVARQSIANGKSALDVVQEAVVALENCVFFNAGRGAVLNAAGEHELEACIVDGSTGFTGAVACVKKLQNPILAARLVMEQTQHCLLAGEGADQLGIQSGLKQVHNSYFSSQGRILQYKASDDASTAATKHPQTVGAAAVDAVGRLAAACSTGGVLRKKPGRIGDTAVIGAGIFANRHTAVLCSGHGDAFLRRQIATQIAYHPANSQQILEELKTTDDAAGATITLDSSGKVSIAQTSSSFFAAACESGKPIWSKVLMKDTPVHPTAFFEDSLVEAFLSPRPSTPYDTVVHIKAGNLNTLSRSEFAQTILSVKQVAAVLKASTGVQRVALVTTSDQNIRLIPLHGLSEEWKPALDSKEEYHSSFPGYISSKNGPKSSNESLTQTQQSIAHDKPAAMDTTFIGEQGKDNLFAKIIRGELEQWRIWESTTHIAFLTPFGNTPGFTVLVPRKHLSSDVLSINDVDLYDFADAIWEVSKLIQSSPSLGVSRVGLIFEGMEIDYAHAKLIPLIGSTAAAETGGESVFVETYTGSVSSKPGPTVAYETLKPLHDKLVSTYNSKQCITATKTWVEPDNHHLQALKSPWYRAVFQIVSSLSLATGEYFKRLLYKYALTPITSDCISSPMGLGSDSLPVQVNLFNHKTYLADSMQFVLEYLLRFDDKLPGTYYVSPSFRGEDPDSTHLNQFFHVECELRGDMDDAITVAERYVVFLTEFMYKEHKDIIQRIAGTTSHVEALLEKFKGGKSFPRVGVDEAIGMFPSGDGFWEYVDTANHRLGRKLTRRGERILIEKYGGFVWLIGMDHLSVPFYQAYVEGKGQEKAKAADLLMGLGETLGLGERHTSTQEVAAALDHHQIPHASYAWYMDIRKIQSLKSSGWGMGSERYMCWLLKHDDVRDFALIPRLKGMKYLP